MKFFTVILLTALLGYAAPLYFSWWSFAVTSFIVSATIHQKPGKSFLAGFLGLFLLWAAHMLIIDNANDHLLSAKVAQILPLSGSYIGLILLTAFIGGLISGLASLTGSFARSNNKSFTA